MRRATGVWYWLVAVVAAGYALGVPVSARAATLAPTPTPYMGWNPYYGVGGRFDQATIESVANELITSGLAKAGYRIVWLDFGWASGERDANGQLVVSATQWPDGMGGLTSWLHARGLEAGIYTDAGRSGCNGLGVGSYGHYQQDADTFAAWGFDAVKVDFCGAGQEIAAGQIDSTPQQLYTQFSGALANNSSARPMILNVCNFWRPGRIDGTWPSVADSVWGSYAWAPRVAQSWRTDTDIGFGGGRGIAFSAVLRNLDSDAMHPEVAGPPSAATPWGHWNDPDYLGPGLGMTDNEAQAQLSMWAMLAAPLILGSDPRALSQAEITMLENPDVIAIDQDTLGAQATLVQQAGPGQVWAKPLANGDVAVALLNRGQAPLTIGTMPGEVGLPPATEYSLRDLWSGTTTTAGAGGAISAVVPPHSATLYRVSATANNPPEPSGSAGLTVTTAGSNPGTVRDSSGSISCPGTCRATYPVGTSVTLSATAPSGATFAGWRGGGCSGIGTCTVAINSDARVTAAFVPAVHTVSVSVTGSGSVADASGAITCPGTCSAAFSDGSTVMLDAAPSSGSTFIGWSGAGCSGTGACSVPVHGPAAVRADFVQLHTLTVSAVGAGRGAITGPGISCPGTCSASYPAGTSVTLTATPGAGSQFGAWLSGCPAGGSSCSVMMASDASVWGAFDRRRSGTAFVVGTGTNTVRTIALASDTAEAAIRGFNHPGAIAVAPDGGTAYVVNRGNGTVTPVDLAINRAEPAITGFHRPGPIAVSPDGRTAYVLEDNRRLVPVDLITDQAGPAIMFRQGAGVGTRAASLAIAPNGRTAYLGTFNGRAGSGTVAVVDLRRRRVRAVIRGFTYPAAIAIVRGGWRAYVADPRPGEVTRVDLATRRRESQIKAPGADGVSITPDGRHVYVADDQGVQAIDAASGRLSAPTVPGAVRGLAITPDGGTVYVSRSDASVVPVDVATDTARRAVTGLSSPGAIAIALPPPRGYTVRLVRGPRRTRGGVTDAVRCMSPTSWCTAIEMISTRARVLGWRTVRIAPGHTVTVTVRVARGRRRFAAVLSLAIRRRGHDDTVMARRLTL